MVTILSNFILLLISPPGFLVSMLLLIYFEYLTLKSIVKDSYGINLNTVISNYVHRHTSKSLPLSSSEQAALDMVYRRENIGTREVSNNIGIAISTTRRLMRDLASKGYVFRKVNKNDRRAFCYMASHKYIQKVKIYNTQDKY